MPSQPSLYRSPAFLTLRPCDEGFLVFDEASGTTSVLDSRAGELLQTLRAAAGPVQMPEASQDLISTLESSGLIVRC